MTDIKQIAAATANRIFDRMELCRGSAMLKSDIERDIEQSLREELEVPEDHQLGVEIYAVQQVIGPHIVVGPPDGLYPPPPEDASPVMKPFVYNRDAILHIVDTDEDKASERMNRLLNKLTNTCVNPPVTVQDADGNIHSFADVDAAIDHLKCAKASNA